MEDNVINDRVDPVVDNEIIPEQNEHEMEPEGGIKKPESAFVKQLKVIGVWIAAIVGFGLLAYLLFYFLQFRPLKLSHAALTENAAQMETQLTDYRDDIASKETLIADLEMKGDGLMVENELFAEYAVYLKLLNNLAQMQKAQMIGDTASMRVALANADANLQKILPLIGSVDAALPDLLQERLALLATSNGDAEELYQEIETIYVYLLELQETLFGTLY